ncbi:MAG: glycosyltransferase family 4 protein [Melioribacteraceae bacterium]|nr:glycosyltransferase family 4 protein [Melioribacteraceae bacterium]
MNIGMVLDNEFTGDLRVENEVQALQKAGFNVFVLCLNYGEKQERERYFGAEIIRVSQSKNKIKKLRALTNSLFNYYPYFWARLIERFIYDNNIDILHVHDLYMFGAAFIVKKKLRKKIIIVGDLHENYVEGLKHYRFSTTFPGNILISIPKWEKKEIEWIKGLDFAVTVIEEAVDRYAQLGIDRNKFTVVSNYINVEEFDKYSIQENITKRFKNYFTLLYVGAFDIHRGIESVIRSLPSLKNKITDLKLVLVGSGQNLGALKELAKSMHVLDIISFEGWQKPETLPSYVIASDICLIPHLKTVHTDNTIPHKLFQYMYLQRPVVSTNCNPIKRILDESEAGLTYLSDDFSELAEKIIWLWMNEAERRQMGIRGKTAVVEKYNWKATSENLVSLYKEIESGLN